VKQFSFAATFVASMLALTSTVPQAMAQQPRTGAPLAVIDVAYIFKYHTRLQTMGNDLQRDIAAAEKSVQDERASFQKLTERLEDYKKGSPEYKSLEEELGRRQADITLKINIQKREFIEQQAKMYSTVYKELSEEVKIYCEQNGIGLVMRFNGDPADYNDPEEIFKDLNKTVIYYNPAIDITPVILKKLNENMGRAPAAAVSGPQTPAGMGQVPAGALPPRPGIPPRR
jgi:Skp family chaperone for outer membrane proteins